MRLNVAVAGNMELCGHRRSPVWWRNFDDAEAEFEV